MRTIFLSAFLAFSFPVFAQKTSYADSIKAYVDNYVAQHEVVKGEDKKDLHFFAPSKTYRVLARFEKKENTPWFLMATSGKMKKMYRVYGVLHFTINKTPLQLNLYQSQDLLLNEQYKNFLFLPFTDATTGKESYGGGRYIDLTFDDIRNNTVLIDFNKAYNPYCAYVSGTYNCPVPPPENNMAIAIKAGEKAYGKH
jgi:uncharacterized protein (DUF1684 family)